MQTGDELIIRDVWGAIAYKGPGYFIAGGAGITPFLAILRWLHQKNKLADNRLFFSNKTKADIIYEDELKAMLGGRAFFLLSKEQRPGYLAGRIDKDFLQARIEDVSRHCYVCGPDAMVAGITATMQQMGAAADSVVFEK